MKIIVQKYGGSSLSTSEAILRVARRVAETRRQDHAVVVVVSAMGGTTDELMALARQLAPDPARRELDVLLGTGEHASMALLAIALDGLGESAVSLTGGQCGILTNDVHMNARILEIRPHRVRRELSRGRIVVAAGFQGINHEGQLTTLGRGGSDTTAVALAAALGAEQCEIYTDVDGVYSADPRVVPGARCLEQLHGGQMEELAWHGAQVLKAEAVELANSNDVTVLVRSTFSDSAGTRVDPDASEPGEGARDAYVPKRPDVAGVSGRKDLLRLTLDGTAFGEAMRQEVLAEIAEYDLIFGGTSAVSREVDLLLSDREIPRVGALQIKLEEHFGDAVRVERDLGAVTLVGFGLGSRPLALLDAMRVLKDLDIKSSQIFTAREALTFVVPEGRVDEAVRTMHATLVESVDREPLLSTVT